MKARILKREEEKIWEEFIQSHPLTTIHQSLEWAHFQSKINYKNMKKLSKKDKILHDQFSIYGKNAKEWMKKCVLMLPEIEKNRIWEKKGFGSIYEYAGKIAGMSRNKVNEGLRVLKKTKDCPSVQKVIEKKGIYAVLPIVTIVTRETDEFWAERAEIMNKNTLETFVRDFKKEQFKQEKEEANQILDRQESSLNNGLPRKASIEENGLNKSNKNQKTDQRVTIQEHKKQITMTLDSKILEELKKIKDEDNWNETMKKLLKLSKKEVEKEEKARKSAKIQLQKELEREKLETVKSNNHTPPAAIQNYIKKRSQGICEHPNCQKEATNFHHIESFSLKKEHDPDKILHVCKEHHDIIHFGYIDDDKIAKRQKRILQESSVNNEQNNKSWEQVENLPSYDIKNFINARIKEHKQGADP